MGGLLGCEGKMTHEDVESGSTFTNETPFHEIEFEFDG